MLGDDNQQEGIFSYVSPEKRVPGDHPLRPIRKMVDEILKEDCAGAAVIWGTPLVLVGQYMIWGRFVYNYWKKQQTYYALTDRRAIIVVNGVGGRTASNAYFENMTIIDKWVRHDGIGSISFGGPAVGEWR